MRSHPTTTVSTTGTSSRQEGFTIACSIALAVLAGALAAQEPTRDQGSDHRSRRFVEVGVPSTGLNRALGQPIWRFPALESFVPLFGEGITLIGFRTLGAFDPLLGAGHGNSPQLTPVTPGDTLLASHLDAFGLSFAGLDPSNVPFEALNVLIDDTPILTDDFGIQHENLPCATEVSQTNVIARAGPCRQPITLDDWMRARGVAVFDCRADGTSHARLLMRRLRPNRMYSVWLVVQDFTSGPRFLVRPIPFGGVPNILVTDPAGRGDLDRTLGFCPHDREEVLGIAVVMRSNGQNYGGVPVPFLNQEDPATAFDGFAGLIPGTVAVVQLSFNIHGIPLNAQEPADD